MTVLISSWVPDPPSTPDDECGCGLLECKCTRFDADAAAAKGFAWLVEEGPRYDLDYRRINPDTLNILSTYNCALAQASGGLCYQHVLMAVIGKDEDWAQGHGFNVGGFRNTSFWKRADAYLELRHAWVKLLRADGQLRNAAMILVA